MKYKLDKYYLWVKKRKIEGIILCSNAIAELKLEAIEYTKNWVQLAGNETV